MIVLITGASHTGKTLLAQKLLEKYKYPYLSVDHLKMGLIRSGQTPLTPLDDEELTDYLWPIIREIIKTAIENSQDLIVEGCYIPLDYRKDFDESYLENIHLVCLVMSENYIRNNSDKILKYENVIEKRLYGDCDVNELIRENNYFLNQCKKYGAEYILIENEYRTDYEI